MFSVKNKIQYISLYYIFVLGDIAYKKPLTSTLSESGVRKTPLSKTRSVQGKTPLSRTKSLTPSIMVTSASSSATNQTVELTSPLAMSVAPPSATASGGHTRLGRADSTNTFTVGGKGGIKVTLTGATPDVEKWKSYDDLLTGFRKKIEASEAQEKERQERQRSFEVSLMSPGATGGSDGASPATSTALVATQ